MTQLTYTLYDCGSGRFEQGLSAAEIGYEIACHDGCRYEVRQCHDRQGRFDGKWQLFTTIPPDHGYHETGLMVPASGVDAATLSLLAQVARDWDYPENVVVCPDDVALETFADNPEILARVATSRD